MITYKLETTLYNPQEKSKEDLIRDFVIRNSEFEQIFKEIKTSDFTLPKQHYLIIGQRGMGKTTLMMRLKFEIEDEKKLANIIPIILKEEHYAIHQLSDLWIQIGEQLEDYHNYNQVISALEEVTYYEEDYAEDTYQVLENKLLEKNNQIVLFIDNFNDLLEKFTEKDVQVLRDILMNKPHIRLVASNPTQPTEISDYQKPLYEFFKTYQLEALSQDEVIQLLLTLAQSHNAEDRINEIIKNSPERINTLRILSGGVPRTISMLFNIFVEEQTQSTIQDLYKLLDEVTPLYKHRMDDLKKNQQKIVYEVAMNWDGISVKELAAKTKMESKTISAQLNLLVKNQVIEKVPTDTKNYFYRLQERFLNIWYLMRLGNKRQHDRVIWLVRFLDTWCNENEMQKRVDLFLEDKSVAKNIREVLNEVYLKSEKVSLKNKQKIINIFSDEISVEEKMEYIDFQDFDYKSLFDLVDLKQYDEFTSIFSTLKYKLRYDILNELLNKLNEENKVIVILESCEIFRQELLLYLLNSFNIENIDKYKKYLEEEIKVIEVEFNVYLDKYSWNYLYYAFELNLIKEPSNISAFLNLSFPGFYFPESVLNYYFNKLTFPQILEAFKDKDFKSDRNYKYFLNHYKHDIFRNRNEKYQVEIYEILTDYFLRLLLREKYFIASNTIENFKMVDYLKPIYYVIQYFLGNQNELKKMPPEMDEVFHEIVESVKKEQKRLRTINPNKCTQFTGFVEI